MRVFIAISFIAVLMLNLFGFYIAFIMNRHEIRKEMQQSLTDSDKENLSVISMSREEFENIVWEKKNKEFRMNDRMFDVEKMEMADDYVTLYVEEDTKETQLVDDFAATVSQQTDQEYPGSPLKAMYNYLMKEFIRHQDTVTYHPSVAFHSLLPSETYTYASFVGNRPSPPPDWQSVS